MGQAHGAQHTADTIVGEQYRQYCDFKQSAVNKAFSKCVGTVSKDSDYNLSPDERQCTEEYAAMYATYLKSAFTQFTQLYEVHQRDLYEKARMEAMQSKARSDLQRAR